MFKKRRALLVALLISTAVPSYAAQINAGQSSISIEGQIELKDVEAFKAVASRMTSATVNLKSPGGQVGAAIAIGELIRVMGYGTNVKEFCASACALIWLSGHPRYMSSTARIGFHAAYDAANQQATSSGNAVVGAYLNKLGLSYNAIAFMTQAPPKNLAYMTPNDAKKFGIEVTVTDRVTGVPQRPAVANTPFQRLGPGKTPAAKVALYEEDQSNPNGTRFVGSALWHTDELALAPGQTPKLAVQADIEVPARGMTVKLILRRNDDKSLPASHVIEIRFTLARDFSHGGIVNVPGLLMKEGETTRGVPLNGVAMKVTTNFFIIGLSQVEADKQRNIQMMRERSWIDVPVVYSDGGRAILAIEKSAPGERAFSVLEPPAVEPAR